AAEAMAVGDRRGSRATRAVTLVELKGLARRAAPVHSSPEIAFFGLRSRRHTVPRVNAETRGPYSSISETGIWSRPPRLDVGNLESGRLSRSGRIAQPRLISLASGRTGGLDHDRVCAAPRSVMGRFPAPGNGERRGCTHHATGLAHRQLRSQWGRRHR